MVRGPFKAVERAGRVRRQGRDDELAGGASGFHVGVGLRDVVEPVGAMDRHDGVAGCDGVEEVPEDVGGEVGGVSAVGGEADSAWEVLDRVLSWAMTAHAYAHAYALVDSYVHGFALQEANLPATGGSDTAELAKRIIAPAPEGAYPHLVAFTAEHVLQSGYDFRAEFEFGLDVILDALEHRA